MAGSEVPGRTLPKGNIGFNDMPIQNRQKIKEATPLRGAAEREVGTGQPADAAYTGSVLLMGMLETELMLVERPRVMSKVAFRAGSSRQGNAWRASVGWNWVTASHLQRSYTRSGQVNCRLTPGHRQPPSEERGQMSGQDGSTGGQVRPGHDGSPGGQVT